jgi:outer membrane protein assembly complex protein YaeT
MMRLFVGFMILFFSFSSFAKYRVDLSQVPPNILESLGTTLKNVVHGKNGEAYLDDMSESEIDDLVKLIYLSAQYDPVKAVLVSDKVVQIKITKRIRLKSVTFNGLKDMNLSEARRIVTAQEGDVFEPDLLVKQGEALQETYKTMGYLNATVDIEFPTSPEGKIDLNVIIRAGSPTRVRKIDFNIDNESFQYPLQSVVKGYNNDILTQDMLKDLQTDVRNFLKSKHAFQANFLAPNISLSSDQRFAFIKFDIKNAERYEFRIEGSTQISSLLSLDDTLDLDNAPTIGTNLLPELTNRLRNYYHQKGYARVEIGVSEKVIDKDNLRQVTFQVKEGTVVNIDKFIFQGRFARKSEYYEDLLLKNSQGPIDRKLYVKEDLDQAVDGFTKELQNDGYLLAQVVSTRATYNAAKDRVNVIVNLDEGLQTSVKAVQFENTSAFPTEKLEKTVGLHPGEPLKLAQIEKAIKDLKTLYRDNGYLEMMVMNEKQDLVTYNEDNSQATMKFRIFEGPQVRVQSIVIEGLRTTKEYVVRFELDFKEGDLLTPAKTDESISNLQRTGYFSSVDIRTLEDKTEVANRTVIVHVTEAEPGTFQIGVGITNERDLSVRGYLGAGYRNLAGTGRGLSFRTDENYNLTDIHYLENRFTVGYLEPFLLDTQYKGRINLTRSNSITDFEAKRATLTIQQTWSIERDFTSHITGIWDVYSRASSEDFNIQGPLDRDEIEIASTGLTLDLDYRDNLVRPRHGDQSRFNVEYGSPWLGSTRTITYVRSFASYTHYSSFVKDRFTWSNGLRYGYLQNLNPRDDGGVPYDKLGFYLGGPSTIRGFDPTREAFPDNGLFNNDKMTKQTEMYLLRSTFSYPIHGIIDGTIFYDGGEVQIGGVDVGFGYRSSAGVGLLVNTPVGPLNLELGWKLGRLYHNQYRHEDPAAFHLSFGSF